jgi:osmotically-inducible protein OsmY
MTKVIPLLLGSLLLLGATACSEKSDPTATDGGVRSDQLASDARARDQRDGANPLAEGEQPTTGDLAVDIRNSLESNLPGSRLAVNVDGENGVATVDGTVVNQEQFDEIEPLTMEFEGIKSVKIEAEINPN